MTVYKCTDQNLKPKPISTYNDEERKNLHLFIEFLNIYWEPAIYKAKEQKQIVQSYFELFQQYLSPRHKKIHSLFS